MLQGRPAQWRHHAEPVAQHLLALGVAAGRAEQVREIHVSGRKLRLQRDGRSIGGRGGVGAAQAGLERAKGDLGLRALGVGGL